MPSSKGRKWVRFFKIILQCWIRTQFAVIGLEWLCAVKVVSQGTAAMASTEVLPASATDPITDKGIVLYDGNCRLCQGSIQVLKRLDWLKKLHCQDCRDIQNLPKCEIPLDPERLLEQMHVVTPDRKRTYAGFAGFRWMAWRMPLTWGIAPLLYLPGARWLGNKVYLWVARNRYNLVPCKDGVCTLPNRGDK
jgi:predicted DCC family thiol-disulfide oxidoreductase YuxK